MKEFLNGAGLKEMLLCAYEALDRDKQAINELNVFPVPDGDTGTNMTLTVSAAATEMHKTEDCRVGYVADKAASAMLRGARGNSGVILSLLFRGIAKGLKGLDECSAKELTQAMRGGVDAAYKAVMKPAEGTILTVSRVAVEAAAAAAAEDPDIETALSRGLEAGRTALAETTKQNPVLARAGVIDAGGKGYITILEAFLDSLQGKIASGGGPVSDGADEGDGGVFDAFSTEEITFTYDTVYIMRKLQPEKPLDLLRTYLNSIGDSLVISEDDEMFKVHVHTNTPGDALTESAKYGVLDVAKIENMRFQHDALLAGKKPETADGIVDPEEDGETEPAVAPPGKQCGFVAVCAGAGMDRLFRELGCDQVVTGGQTMNPSTQDLLNAVNRTPAEVVFILPNNKNIIMAAEQCVPISTEKRVIVVPTKTVPQGITAMLNLDTDASPEEILQTFTDVIGNVHTIQVTDAVRDSDIDGHKIKEGELLCLMDGAILESTSKTGAMTRQICKAIRKLEPEFVTVYFGERASEVQAKELTDAISDAVPGADVTMVDGGQPVYYFMISVE